MVFSCNFVFFSPGSETSGSCARLFFIHCYRKIKKIHYIWLEQKLNLMDAKTKGIVAHLTLVGWIVALVLNMNQKEEYASYYINVSST